MPILCSANKHVWTIATLTHCLAPYHDLIPGTRCSCGTHVILPRPRPGCHDSCFFVAHLDSAQVARVVALHPEFKTW